MFDTDEAKLAYTAGYLEGEGCFTPKRRSGSSVGLLIQAGSTDPEPLEWLHAQYGGSLTGPTPRAEPQKPMYFWRLQGDTARDLMESLLPFLSHRRRHSVLHALEERRAYEETRCATTQ